MVPPGERREPCEHLVKKASKRPHVGFMVVSLTSQDFWSHQEGCAARRFCEFILRKFSSKTQVSDFDLHFCDFALTNKLAFFQVLTHVEIGVIDDVTRQLREVDQNVWQL